MSSIANAYQITCIRLPVEVPSAFLQRVPESSSPFSILTKVSPGVMNPDSDSECQAEVLVRLICFGIIRLKTCFPVQRGCGFKTAGAGIFPSKSSHHIKIFMKTSCKFINPISRSQLTRNKNVHRLKRQEITIILLSPLL